MKRRQFLLGSSAALASGMLLTETTAFTSTEARRGVDVAVVGDENAYLGLSDDEIREGGQLFGTGLPRTTPEAFSITNQTTTPIRVEVELLDGNLVFGDVETDGGSTISERSDDRVVIDEVGPGTEIPTVEVALPDGSSSTREDRLRFHVVESVGASVDPSIEIAATRTLALEPRLDVRFNGAGSVEIDADATGPYELVYWTAETESPSDDEGTNEGNGKGADESNGGEGNSSDRSEGAGNGGNGRSPGPITNLTRQSIGEFGPSGSLDGASDGGPGYIGVYFPRIGVSYHHPGFDPEKDRIENWGAGDGVRVSGSLF